MIAIKVVLICGLTGITIQDMRDRRVYWFLFPMVGICSGILFYSSAIITSFKASVGMNLLVVFSILALISFYVRIMLNSKLFEVLGLGDILLFVGLAFSFSTVSFIVLLVCSLIFSLLLHLFLTRGSNQITVPLAGYVSLFFGLSFMAFWSGLINSLYSI